MLKEFGGGLELIKNWIQLLLCSIKIFVFTFSGMLKEFGGGLELIKNWTQSVF